MQKDIIIDVRRSPAEPRLAPLFPRSTYVSQLEPRAPVQPSEASRALPAAPGRFTKSANRPFPTVEDHEAGCAIAGEKNEALALGTQGM